MGKHCRNIRDFEIETLDEWHGCVYMRKQSGFLGADVPERFGASFAYEAQNNWKTKQEKCFPSMRHHCNREQMLRIRSVRPEFFWGERENKWSVKNAVSASHLFQVLVGFLLPFPWCLIIWTRWTSMSEKLISLPVFCAKSLELQSACPVPAKYFHIRLFYSSAKPDSRFAILEMIPALRANLQWDTSLGCSSLHRSMIRSEKPPSSVSSVPKALKETASVSVRRTEKGWTEFCSS